MKKQIFISYILIAIVIGASQISFTNNLADQVLQEATENFHQGLADLKNQIQEYDKLAIDFTSEKKSIELLQKTHLETRLTFKKIEFLLEYYDRYSIKKYINGAPLPSVEPKVAEVVEVEPEGLQVLDELVFGANIFEEKEQIKELTKKLKYKYQSIYRYQLKLRVTHRHLFEAMRQELVRVFTLGVTGFDTPGSANALPEAKKALEGIQTTIKIYTPLISSKNQNLISDIENLLDDAILFLKKNNDFETFDRLYFLKNYINPLYQKIYEAHLILQIETIEETNDQVQPTNYHATGIFDENEIYSYITEGIGEDILPKNVDFSVIDGFTKVTDKDAAVYTQLLAKEEGMFLGNSAGAAIKGVLQLKAHFKKDDVVVVLFHDHGSRYVGKMFNNEWMKKMGYIE